MLHKTDVIDLITEEADGYCGLSLIVESGEWDAPDAPAMLDDKANTYAVFACGGELALRFAKLNPGKVRILLQSMDPLPEWADRACERIRQQLAAHRIALQVARLGAP